MPAPEGEKNPSSNRHPGIDPTRQEIRVLRASDGKGYARLLRADEDQNALLLEKLGAQLHEFYLSEDEQLRIICETLHEAWMPCPEGLAFATGADKAAEFAHVIESNWSARGLPCRERTVETVLSYAEQRRRAFDSVTSVLVHGDAHQWNALWAPGSATGFKFIDPDGAYAERAFDLAVSMREWGSVIPGGDLLRLGRHRCRALAQFSGVDENAIWQWGLIQCVWNGIQLLQIDANDSAAVEFAMADPWAADSA